MENNEEKKFSDDNEGFDFNITEWIKFFWSNKFVFIKFAAAASIIGVVVALLLPKQYTAVATILPPHTSNKPGILSQLSQVVGSSSIGGSEINKLFPDIAISRTVLTEVLDAEYNEESFFNVLTKERETDRDDDETVAREEVFVSLQKMINTNVDRITSLVTVKLTYHDPEIAAALINEILSQMDNYLRYNLKTAATGQSQMIENRLYEISDSLKFAEDNLLKFRESNRTTNLSPKLQIYEMRLLREVEVNNAVYIELTRQFEVARIQEDQLRPVLNVLDKAIPPVKRSAPKRRKIVIVFIMAGFVMAFIYSKYVPDIKNIVEDLKNIKDY